MKINIEIDMSPEEARKIMGLPNVEHLQEEMLAKIQEKMNASLDKMSDPELLMKQFLPVGIQGMEQVQEFFSGIAKAAASSKKNEDVKKKG
jgi:hypothetical protein